MRDVTQHCIAAVCPEMTAPTDSRKWRLADRDHRFAPWHKLFSFPLRLYGLHTGRGAVKLSDRPGDEMVMQPEVPNARKGRVYVDVHVVHSLLLLAVRASCVFQHAQNSSGRPPKHHPCLSDSWNPRRGSGKQAGTSLPMPASRSAASHCVASRCGANHSVVNPGASHGVSSVVSELGPHQPDLRN